jgi:4-hydroxy-tetrahydrodipicolinate synthase
MSFDLTRYHGIFPAAMTMFDAAGDLDERATADHWNWLIEQGAHGLVICGTSGEFIALQPDEQRRLYALAVEVAAGRVPVVAGTGHYTTRLTIEQTLAAQRLGADAAIVILPYYQKPPKAAVLDHYRRLRQAVPDLPIMLYNNPLYSGCAEITPLEIAALVDEGVIQMVKSTFESVVPVHDLAYLVGDRMRVFYGSFSSAYEGLAAGAHGWVSGVLNVAAREAVQLYQAVAVDQDLRRGFELWMRILPLVHLYTHKQLGDVNDLAIYRSILAHWGRPRTWSRLPFAPLTADQERKLIERLVASRWSLVASR